MSKRLVRTALGAACLVAVSIAWDALRFGGGTATVAVQDVGEATAALLAAASCAYTARQSTGSVRRAWTLIAASALSWAAGETVWSVYEVGLGQAVPFPSAADAGFMTAIPLMLAGVLQLGHRSGRPLARLHAVIDGLIVATALLFAAWAIGLNDLYAHEPVPLPGSILVAVYPAADIVILTLLATSLRRASMRLRIVLGFLIAGYVAILAADGSFAYLMLRGQYGILGSLSDNGWFAGYLGIGLAAMWPAGAGAAVSAEHDEPVELWQLALPWAGAVVVIASAAFVALGHLNPGPILTGIGSGFGVLFMASQAIAFRDTVLLLHKSRRNERQIREQTRLVSELFERAPLGILRVGADLRVIDSNPAAQAMMGAPFNKHSAVTDYLTAEEMQRLAVLIRPLWSDETDNVEADQDARRADGTPIWIHWSVTAVRKTDHEVDYFLVMMDDVTVKHQNEEAARANTAALERLNRLKSEFMSMVSHEFRTALTGIQGYSEIMATQEVSPAEVKEFSGDINADALRLNRMITEMLDLDRIESGRISLHLGSTDLNRLVAEAVDRARMTSGKHTLVMKLDANAPLLTADQDRLTEVLTNLLSNAIKYSPDGGEIVITTRLKNDAVEVSVKDHGIGIPPDFVKRIFNRYERYEAAGKPQVVGTGLGLAISKQIVQMHAGEMWVDSTLGEGSEFHFTIPIRPAAAAEPPGRVA